VSYYRAVELPAEVGKNKAKAYYNNGVLTVTLFMSKKQEEKPSGIPVS
jgi:HSP20 family molecular chaperone IbpA